MRSTWSDVLWAQLSGRLDADERVVARGRAFEPVFDGWQDDLAFLVSGPGCAVLVTDRRLLWVGHAGAEWVRSVPFGSVRSFTQVTQTHRYALILEHERVARARLSFVVPFASQGRMRRVTRKAGRSTLAFSRRDTQVARAVRAALRASGAVEAPKMILPRPPPNEGSSALSVVEAVEARDARLASERVHTLMPMVSSDDAERAWHALLTAMRAFPSLMPGGSWTGRETLAIARSPACPVPILNAIWVLGDPPATDVIAAAESLEADRLPAPIIVREGRSPSIEAAAPGLGLILEERIPLMVTTPSELAMGSVEGLELRVVTDERGLDEARRLLETGFGAPDGLLRPMYAPPLTDDPRFTTAVARTVDGPVCTAQTMRRDDDVGIYSVATLPSHRGHGYGGALSAWVTERAFADGATFAYLQSSAMGVSVYRRIGFREVDMFAVYTRPAPSQAAEPSAP